MPAAPPAAAFLSLDDAPAVAMGMTYVAAANSFGLALANAAAAQQRGQLLGAAALTQVLALIIVKGGAS